MPKRLDVSKAYIALFLVNIHLYREQPWPSGLEQRTCKQQVGVLFPRKVMGGDKKGIQH